MKICACVSWHHERSTGVCTCKPNTAILQTLAMMTVFAFSFLGRFGVLLAEGPNNSKVPHATSKASEIASKEVVAVLAENRKQLERLLILAQEKPGEIAGIRQALGDMARHAKLAGFLLDSLPAERKTILALDTIHPEIVLPAFSRDADVQVKALYAIAKLPRASFKQAEPLVARGLDSNVPSVQIAAANAIEAKGIVVSRRLRESMLAVLSRAEPREWSRHIVAGWHIKGNMPVLRQVILAVISVGDQQVAEGIVKLLAQRKGRCISRSMWLCHILHRIADRRVVPYLAKVLLDKSQRRPLLRQTLAPPTSGPKLKAYISPADAILLTLLKLTRQTYDEYGFEMKIAFTFTEPAFYGFASSKDQTRAIEKFNTWWIEHRAEFSKEKPVPQVKKNAGEDAQ